jgi:epoxide hydrolase 4
MITHHTYHLPHGIQLSCRISGSPDRPVLMFLHGFPQAAFAWDELLHHFSSPQNGGYFCIAPNLRGYENSSKPDEISAYRAKNLVQDIDALKELVSPNQPLAGLIAHDWGGAVAWNYANQHPEKMQKLCIINSPHPGTFLRELRQNPEQQKASAYMNFLIRDDAEKLLAEDDYRRLWEFFSLMNAEQGPHAWLNEQVKEQYRQLWNQGLTGPLNYYRASPMRPAEQETDAINQLQIPDSMLTIKIPTCVIWAMADIALPPNLLDGLEAYISNLTIHKIPEGTHWIIQEQPKLVAQWLQAFLLRPK